MSPKLDQLTTSELVDIFLRKEEETLAVLKNEKINLIKTISAIYKNIQHSGRVIYVGAGTSGRLGVLDSVECKPTFNTDIFSFLIAGGKSAIFKAKEGSEDDEDQAVLDLKKIKLKKYDVIVGIAASGETPYTISAIKYANKLKLLTVGVSSNPKSTLARIAKLKITPNIQNEIICGSSRLSSGTAQKIILNMISSITMIQSGKVLGDLMIDVLPTNKKLVKRAIGIISNVCKLSDEESTVLFKNANGNARLAIVMYYSDCDLNTAKKIVKKRGFKLRELLH